MSDRVGTRGGWRAAAYAAKHDAVLVFESTDRAIRHPDYHSRANPNAQARDVDLEELRQWTDGVPLFTLLPPNATSGEVRAYQTKRGQATKGRKGGRPRKNPPGYKKQRRQKLLRRVLKLRRNGASYRKIARECGVPTTTLHAWVSSRC